MALAAPILYFSFITYIHGFLIISTFLEVVQKICNRQTHAHAPSPTPPDRNIAEEYLESRTFRIHCKIINAEEIPNWRCLTAHQDGRVSLKDYGHIDKSTWINMIH